LGEIFSTSRDRP